MEEELRELPSVNRDVVVCVNDGENVYFMIAHRTHADVADSWAYFSPEHGEEFELKNVSDWHPLP